MDCNTLMKDALERIDIRYRLDDVLSEIPDNQKFTREQMMGYLKKQGRDVTEAEIKKSGIDKMFGDGFAFTGKEWKDSFAKLGNKHHISKVDTTEYGASPGLDYDNVTLGTRGMENPSYKETLYQTTAPKKGPETQRHYDEFQNNTTANLGWTRVHEDTINGDNVLVLNELQSDWAQAERAGEGTFKSNRNGRVQVERDFLNALNDFENKYGISYIDAFKNWPLEKLKDNKDIREIQRLNIKRNIIQDFPMSPKKFQQFQIVDAINQAVERGLYKVVIPIERENELVGSEGATKFYRNLNKTILKEIRQKLNKQGYKLDTKIEPYENSNQLHAIEIKAVPLNKRAKWNYYQLLGTLGLGAVAEKMQEPTKE